MPFVAFAICALFLGCRPEEPKETAAQAITRIASVHVTFYEGTTDKSARTCLGTLIAPRVVLTAAHCTAGRSHGYVVASDAHGQKSTIGDVESWGVPASDEDDPLALDVALLTLDKPISSLTTRASRRPDVPAAASCKSGRRPRATRTRSR